MDARELPAQELVQQAMRVLGARTAPQLADKLGMTRRNQENTVRRWIKGYARPGYASTLKLLTAVGLLQDERAGAVAARGDAARSALADDAAVAEAVEDITRALARLRTAVLGPARQADGGAG